MNLRWWVFVHGLLLLPGLNLLDINIEILAGKQLSASYKSYQHFYAPSTLSMSAYMVIYQAWLPKSSTGACSAPQRLELSGSSLPVVSYPEVWPLQIKQQDQRACFLLRPPNYRPTTHFLVVKLSVHHKHRAEASLKKGQWDGHRLWFIPQCTLRCSFPFYCVQAKSERWLDDYIILYINRVNICFKFLCWQRHKSVKHGDS